MSNAVKIVDKKIYWHCLLFSDALKNLPRALSGPGSRSWVSFIKGAVGLQQVISVLLYLLCAVWGWPGISFSALGLFGNILYKVLSQPTSFSLFLRQSLEKLFVPQWRHRGAKILPWALPEQRKCQDATGMWPPVNLMPQLKPVSFYFSVPKILFTGLQLWEKNFKNCHCCMLSYFIASSMYVCWTEGPRLNKCLACPPSTLFMSL